MDVFLNSLNVFALILFLCSVALMVIRFMGNRTVGQLSPFDFVIMVGMGDIIVTTAMDKNQSIFAGIGGLVALLFLQQLLSYLSLKSIFLRRMFEGVPVVLIRNGRIIQENFTKTRFNYDDLRQELHKLGMDMTQVKDIKLARLESCGVFTIIKNYDLEPLSKRDLILYLEEMRENPLSPIGQEWMKISQMAEEVHMIAEALKKDKQKGNS
ncbi:DUF421 domain-containing protein [Anaerosinus massiliensis]|uniref:DUF421 domain-containing protein n=1 Tax=Massilibacillus massiliensis TaxID=1806837 RepID=UPI000AC05052|nr:YetF domain-containing protein [Massilibacillus massiliensis]